MLVVLYGHYGLGKRSKKSRPERTNLEAPKPTQDPEIPKKTPRSHELFRKVRANFSLLSCDTSQEPSGNCSDKLVQMNFFILGGFFRVDFPPVRISGQKKTPVGAA